jgi:hypothetical protein
MTPQFRPHKKSNSSKVNLTLSLVFHAVVLVVFFFVAAHEGFLGEKLEKITSITMVKEQKPPEPPKEPPKPPKVEPPKTAPPKIELPTVQPPKVVTAPKPQAPEAPPATAHVAPAAVEMPSFDFGGGKTIATSSDPVEIYKSYVEYAFLSKWNQPDNIADDFNAVTEVEVSVDADGRISHPVWTQNSGDTKWNDSIRQAIAAVTKLDNPPPTNFPPHLTIIFNVRNESTTASEASLQ